MNSFIAKFLLEIELGNKHISIKLLGINYKTISENPLQIVPEPIVLLENIFKIGSWEEINDPEIFAIELAITASKDILREITKQGNVRIKFITPLE
jgi:hypothetical protein